MCIYYVLVIHNVIYNTGLICLMLIVVGWQLHSRRHFVFWNLLRFSIMECIFFSYLKLISVYSQIIKMECQVWKNEHFRHLSFCSYSRF